MLRHSYLRSPDDPERKWWGQSSQLPELKESLSCDSAPEGRAHAGTVSRCPSRGLPGFLSLVTSALPGSAFIPPCILPFVFLHLFVLCVHMHGYDMHTCGSQRTPWEQVTPSTT